MLSRVNPPPRVVGDALLVLFAMAVVIGCVVVVTRQVNPEPMAASTQGQQTPFVPLQTSTPDPTTTPTPDGLVVVVAGPDLAKLQADLATLSGDTVLVAKSDAKQPLAAHALDTIKQTPSFVIVQITAGTRTSGRTTETITAVRKRWPAAKLLLVGPFSSNDRKSAAAVKAGAALAHVTFLDPVDLKWRIKDTSATLGDKDLAPVAAAISRALR